MLVVTIALTFSAWRTDRAPGGGILPRDPGRHREARHKIAGRRDRADHDQQERQERKRRENQSAPDGPRGRDAC
jgi:hypothetical protein